MVTQVIATPKAPPAIGPYSQAILVNGFVFTAGQLGLDPETKKLVSSDVAAQTRQALNNIIAILDAAGTSMAYVVKTTVFLVDMADFGAMNSVYAEFFPTTPPARSTVQVGALPLGGRVEIEAVAVIK